MATNASSRMSTALRVSVKAAATLLWLTGCGWLIAHFFLQQPNEFGIGPSPWESPLMTLHGIAAVGGVFLLGWIASRHIPEGWQSRNRATGLILTAASAVLALSGYALYYVTDDALHTATASIHELLGGCGIVIALLHWRYRRARASPTGDV